MNSKCFTKQSPSTRHYSWHLPPVTPRRPPNSPAVRISQRELKLPAAKPPAKLTNGRARIWNPICLAHKSESFHYITLPPIGSINPYQTLKGRHYPHFREAGSETQSIYQTSLQLVSGRVGKAIALKPDSSATY